MKPFTITFRSGSILQTLVVWSDTAASAQTALLEWQGEITIESVREAQRT